MSTGVDHTHSSPSDGPHRAGTTVVLVAAAFVWGLLIIVAAMTVPVVTVLPPPVTATATAPPGASATSGATDDTGNGSALQASPRVTVLRYDGLAGVAVAGVPATVSLLVAGLLWMGSRGRRALFVPMAWTLSTALVVAGIVGLLTILVGIVAVPAGVLLIIACSQAQRRRHVVPVRA